jgi:hypothetical protein
MDSVAAETTIALQRKLREAQRAYQRAVSEYRRLIAISSDTSAVDDPGRVDGNHAFHQALITHGRARVDYERALKEFTEHVLRSTTGFENRQ